MEKCKIIFYPWKKEVTIPSGTDLLTAAIRAGVHIYNSCGGEGVCGRCKVIVRKGEVVTEPTGRLSAEERKKGYVLACRTTCKGRMDIEVPPESRLEGLEILTEEAKAKRLVGLYTPAEEVEKGPEVALERVFTHGPLSTKLYLELSSPTLEDNVGDLERVYREIRKGREIPIMQMGLANIKKLSKLLRDSSWKVTATLGNRNETTEVVLIEPGDTTNKNYGVAVDIGTTTIVAYLVNLAERQVLGAKACYNPQVDFGEDVISRIIFAQEKDGQERLHHVVIDAINNLILGMVLENNLTLNDINGVACAGNTTMIHLLLRVPPEYLRKEPYVPTAGFIPVIRAAEAGIKINPRGLLCCIPGVSSYVGGDITAGVLASGLDDLPTLGLFIDLGTNGEVVLGNKDWLVCCSTSAGPCFEGGGIKWGIRAMKGAIQRVKINPSRDKVKLHTIGEEKPKGICGAGLVDCVAELLKSGRLNRAGKLIPGSSKRIREGEDGWEFVLVESKKSLVSQDIVITETDIKNLIHSKGAIYSGAEVLLKRVGLSSRDLEQVFIAGGLGTALDVEKAIMIGLLPDLPQEKFTFIGNSAIAGTKMCLLSQEAMRKAEKIAGRMTYVDLSTEPEFMNNYTASLFLPHTDINLFPSVKKLIKS
ncbi:MAG: ASKHA domain-containing protein [bacterium]